MSTFVREFTRKKHMDFSNFSLDKFYSEEVPLKDLLVDSAYYPASGDDGFPMRVCNMSWADLKVNSYIYCDFAFTRKEVEEGILGSIHGYTKIAERWLDAEEFIPKGWKLNLYGAPKEKYRDRRFADRPDPEHFALWRIFHRWNYKSDSFGPEYLSFLYVGGEGFATYQQLYCENKVAPKLLFFVQPHDMCAPADDWTSDKSAFFRMIKDNHECAPEWVACGDHGDIEAALRVWNMEELGAKTLGYGGAFKSPFDRDVQFEPVDIPNNGTIRYMKAKKVVVGDRSFLSVDFLKHSILYEIIDNSVTAEQLVTKIVKRGSIDYHNKW